MQPSKPLRRPSLHQLRSANRRPLQYCGNERQKRQSRWLAVAARKRRPKKYGSHVSPNLLSAVPTFTHTSANEALPLGHKVRRRNHPGALDSGAFAAQLATTPAVLHSLQLRGRRLSEYSCSVTNKQISVCVVLAFRASLGRVGGITHSSQPLHECSRGRVQTPGPQPLLLKPKPFQTVLQAREPSAQPPMSQSPQCGPDSGAAQSASAPGSAAHVSTNSAEQPGSRNSADGSVEQSAPPAPFDTLAHLCHWLEQLPETERTTDPICRVRNALRVLELDTSRDARTQLQALLKSWDIKQKDPSNKKRSVVEVHQRLRAAVLKEGDRLRTMASFSNRASFENVFRSSAAQRAPRTSPRARSRSARR
jgi:hypothetical protein